VRALPPKTLTHRDMKWFCNQCRRRRRDICLFAAGALPEQDRPEIQQHLAACAGCRDYYNEIMALAAPLANWEKNFAQIEPTHAMRRRWVGAVQASAAEAAARKGRISALPPFDLPIPSPHEVGRGSGRGVCPIQHSQGQDAPAPEPLLKNFWRNVWRELFWPCRRAWVGLAALWLVLLAVNMRLSDHPMQMAGASSSSPLEMMQAWEEQTRLLAELTQPAMVHSAPVNPPAAPANPPRPRSERKPDWQIV